MELLNCDSDARSMRPWHYNLNVASVHVDERRAENLTAYYFPNLYLRHRDKLLGLGHKVRHPGARQKVNVSLYAVSAGQDGYLCHVFRCSFRCSHGLLSSWFWSLHSNKSLTQFEFTGTCESWWLCRTSGSVSSATARSRRRAARRKNSLRSYAPR